MTPTPCVIALAGNPNAGKSTIFNALTGGRQHTGNWPGKTVEKKQGVFKHHGQQITVVDLPGTYSLSAWSLEEQIARDFLVEERPHAVVNVVDAANLERNLYLTAQILEIGIPVIIALNMMDIAESRQITIDLRQVAEILPNVVIIPMVASRGKGIDALKEAIAVLPSESERQSHENQSIPLAERSKSA
ncbi:MAG: iron transporter FeoB [Chloroflexaceae bacterium]|nr:iron transporter FeoB [Chloroflexaceae bacterium]